MAIRNPEPLEAERSALDVEPALRAMFAARPQRRSLPAYSARNTADIVEALRRFFAIHAPGAVATGVRRMGGGASKEQFVFDLRFADASTARFVLRMDPLEAITETSRKREYEVLKAVQGIIPAPNPRWLDEHGEFFGKPAAIMEFVGGVAKPSGAGVKVSGLGTLLGEPLRAKLKKPFLDHLVALHGIDWTKAPLPSFSAPNGDSRQAARWTLNYWHQLWVEDSVEPHPMMTYVHQWLLDNLPECRELVLTHGDYRTGNYLFDEASGRMVAMLDWELARIGDFHEDVAWVLMKIFGTNEDGIFRASDLFEREEFILAYEKATGRRVDRKTLHFYDVLSCWKCYVIVAASGMSVARAQHNHQDVLLTFLGAAGPLFIADMCRLLGETK
jgi:aminoglycoside phosphotransferase (APT) family kinase protein